MRFNFPISTWGYAILHARTLVCLRPSSLESITPTKAVFGQVPSIKHLIFFGCKVLVPISSPHRTKMGPQMKGEIYGGCELPNINRYLDLPTGNLLQGRFANCFSRRKNFHVW